MILATWMAVWGVQGLSAADAWTQVKAGMTKAETLATLGQPLITSKGRQFELWIYDSGAEVVCLRGSVVAWTPPVGSEASEGRELDLRGVITPIDVAPARLAPVATPAARDHGYEPLNPRRLRMRRL